MASMISSKSLIKTCDHQTKDRTLRAHRTLFSFLMDISGDGY